MQQPVVGRWQSLGILLTATICIAIAGIHFHVVGAMVMPLNKAFGWSRGEIAFALSISSLIGPFTNIAIGILADKYGPRKVALPGVVFFCIGLALLGLAGPSLWSWYAGYAAFAILNSGASTVVWTMSVVQTFKARRGLALAVALAGSGLLVSLIPSIVLALDTQFGVRGVYPALALISLCLMFIPAWFFMPRIQTSIQNPVAKEKGRWKVIIADARLWRLGVGLLIVASTVGTFIVHFQPMLTDAGFTREKAAYVALFVGPAMVVGRIGTGLLFDILPTRLVAVAAFSLPGFACLLLLFLPLTQASAIMLAILIGLGMGSEVDVVAYLSSRYFGLADYGLVFGILISLYGVAVGMSSWAVGHAYDVAGSYLPVLMILAGGVVLAMLLVYSLGRPPAKEVAA